MKQRATPTAEEMQTLPISPDFVRRDAAGEIVCASCVSHPNPATHVGHYLKTDGSGIGQWAACHGHAEMMLVAGWLPVMPIAEYLAANPQGTTP